MFKPEMLTRTVIDTNKCVDNIGNRFALVLVAAIRARELKRGSRPLVDNANKTTPNVLALKEIQEGKIGFDYLRKIR